MIGNATRRHRTAPWLALGFLLCAATAEAGVVTTLADSGAGSLREQVNAGGAVTFAAGLTGTINLTGTPISITSSTPSITGPGANAITINAGNARRIFMVSANGTTLSGLTLTSGASDQGGAILNTGNLTLNAVAITSSAATDSGGGVYNTGTLTVTSSTFSGNSVTAGNCAGGGAIRSEGPGSVLVVTNSTITGNSAAACNGGGISFNNGTASITASTITANSAGLGGGNLYKGSSVAGLTMSSSVISDGTAGGGTPTNPDMHGAFAGGLTSSGYNLVKTRGDSIGYVASDLADGTSPLLGALANNSGPTSTQLPQLTSPLLETLAPCQATDQRGFTRPQGNRCDIGAVEYRQFPLTATIVGSGSVSAGATPTPTIGSISNCTGNCTAYYDGEVQPTVTLTATPNANQLFSGWSGACPGSANPVTTVTMTSAKTCIATFVPNTFTVTSSVSGGNGSITPAGSQVVNGGTNVVFTLSPAPNYHVANVDGTCGGTLSGPGNTTYTTNAVSANCTVVAHFSIDQHVVLASVAGGNGSINPVGAVNVDHGSSTVFTLSPSANYHVTGVDGSCGGVLSGPNNTTYTTAAITADCTVVAHFAIDQHTVTPSVSGGNGTISPSTTVQVNHGATTVFTLTPSANYHVASVDGSCGGVLSGPNNTIYTTAAVNADCSVVAHFSIDQHTVTPSVAGGNGSISPSTAVQVDHGATTVFTLTPSANYHVASVDGSCGGALSGPNNTTYTTNAVNADCTVVAHFTIDQHTVTPSVAGGNGTISPSTAVQVNHGATTVFTLAPSANYHVASVDGSCGGVLSGPSNTTYTTNAVTADCTVVAHFTIDQHVVTPSVVGGNGTITPSTTVQVDHGATTVFTLAPAASHHVASVDGTCGGALSGPGNTTYTTNAITADCTVVAHFAIDTHTVGGTVNGLVGSAMVLRLNGGNPLLIGANGSFVFAQPLDDLSPYAVTIAQQPTAPTQVCTVSNGSGTLAGSDITNVVVNCPAPLAHLILNVSDSRNYARYGMLLNYIVTLTNDGNGDATGVSLGNVSPPQLDTAATTWTCQGAGGGATCTASGSGALNDANVRVPIGRTLTWIVTSPVRLDASGGAVAYTVNAAGGGAASATDQDTLVIMRTGMDVAYGDGAESVSDPASVACTPAGNTQQRFDLTTTRTFALPATASAAIDVVLAARAANGAGLRVERLNTGAAPSLRLVTIEQSGIERAGAWAATTPGATLAIGVATAGEHSVLLLEGNGITIESALPDGVDASVQARLPTRDCAL
jgi:hypothetical protein